MQDLTNHLISEYIYLDETSRDYPFLVISNQQASAKIALHGAHVIDYTPADQQPVIFTSKDAIYREGKAIRGGIPVCWPWFNAHPTDSSKPSHGYARAGFWELVTTSTTDELTTLVFTFSTEELTAELTIKVGSSLELSLKTTNQSDTVQPVGGALHSYFSISNIADVSITGLENNDYLDTVNNVPGKEDAPITINQEIDRVYYPTTTTAVIHDSQWKRAITVEKSGSQSTVVWNPWIDKSATMSDLGNEEYQTFVCIETANALEDVYPVASGESHTMATIISAASKV